MKLERHLGDCDKSSHSSVIKSTLCNNVGECEVTGTSSLCSVAEHLLCSAALLLWSGRLAVAVSAWL